jgi:hypothetical protein
MEWMAPAKKNSYTQQSVIPTVRSAAGALTHSIGWSRLDALERLQNNNIAYWIVNYSRTPNNPVMQKTIKEQMEYIELK